MRRLFTAVLVISALFAEAKVHACSTASSIVGWGCNYKGQATLPDGNNFVAISASGYHSLALKSDGSIVS